MEREGDRVITQSIYQSATESGGGAELASYSIYAPEMGTLDWRVTSVEDM